MRYIEINSYVSGKCVVVAVGRILRFDEVRGYGFIAPSSGGEDVFVHANDFGEDRHRVRPGMRVEYEAEESDRGLKTTWVRITDAGEGKPAETAAVTRAAASTTEDDGLCDVLSAREFQQALTELLVDEVPS